MDINIILNFNDSTIFLLCYPVWNDKYLFFPSLYISIMKYMDMFNIIKGFITMRMFL